MTPNQLMVLIEILRSACSLALGGVFIARQYRAEARSGNYLRSTCFAMLLNAIVLGSVILPLFNLHVIDVHTSLGVELYVGFSVLTLIPLSILCAEWQVRKIASRRPSRAQQFTKLVHTAANRPVRVAVGSVNHSVTDPQAKLRRRIKLRAAATAATAPVAGTVATNGVTAVAGKQGAGARAEIDPLPVHLVVGRIR